VNDLRHEWPVLIYEAYMGNVVISAEKVLVKYQKNTKATLIQEQALIIAQGVHVDSGTADLCEHELDCLDVLGSDEGQCWMMISLG
jgi:hypothetical protein